MVWRHWAGWTLGSLKKDMWECAVALALYSVMFVRGNLKVHQDHEKTAAGREFASPDNV